MEFFHREFRTKSWLYYKYWIERLSQQNIADICGVTQQAIRRWLRKFTIPIRSISDGRKEYFKKNPGIMKGDKRYANWGKKNPMYGLRLENNPSWRGGVRKTYRNTSRRALEEWWNQRIPSGYLGHHIDKDEKNNDITNLAWLTNRGHAVIHQSHKNLGKYARRNHEMSSP